MRVGIWRPGGLGDSLLLAPALRALRQAQPKTHIHLWGRTEGAFVLLMAGLVDSIDDSSSGLRFPTAPLDLFVGYEWEPQTMERIAEMHGIPAARCYNHISPSGVHQARWMYDTLCQAADITAPYVPRARLTLPPPASFRDTLPGYIVLHPGASMARKRWPLHRFHDLARRLVRRGERVAIIEPPGEDYGQVDGVEIVSRPFLALAWFLKDCKAFVGNDSACAHLAAMVGVPTVAIFGPMPHARWLPLGDVVRWVQTCPAMLASDLPYHRGHDCYRDLHVDDVDEQLVLALTQQTAAYRARYYPQWTAA